MTDKIFKTEEEWKNKERKTQTMKDKEAGKGKPEQYHELRSV